MSARSRLPLLGAALGVGALVAGATPAVAASSPWPLAQARAATAAFQNPDRAIAAGYIPTDVCVSVPGLGTMGQHWVNPSLLTNDRDDLDPRKPQALLYVPAADGGVRLVAIEYIVFTGGDPRTPRLFGQRFDGPMPGHEPGMGEHWDLHVWLYAHNPEGRFNDFNRSSSISC